MQALINRIKNISEIDINSILMQIFSNKDMQESILDLNRQDQLFEKGIDSEGVRLSEIGGNYSGFTLQRAVEQGRPKKSESLINLHDTGAFYESFYLRVGQTEIVIVANTIKEDTDLAKEWGEAIIGLTEESKNILILWVHEEIIPKIREQIFSS